MIAFCCATLKEVTNLETRLMARLIRNAIVASGLFIRIGCLCAQSSYTPGDVADGHRLYLASCAACHGPEGDAVPDVTLGQGKFRRASSDNDLVQIIRNGIAGTAMPPGNFSPTQAKVIVAYLRSLAETQARTGSTEGVASRGEVLFDGKGECLKCHRVKNSGSRLGPDLTDIGNLRTAAELERSLLDPGAEVLPQNRLIRVALKNGSPITGRLLNQDTFSVQLIDGNNRLLSLPRSGMKELTFLDQSIMPSYRDKFSVQELQDLVSYLVSLKGISPQ
jgi:putative heme-binding domain-containing protein